MSTTQFPIGQVFVEVHHACGDIHIEDWSPSDAETAKEYAGEVAAYSDVTKAIFRSPQGDLTFCNPGLPKSESHV